MTTKTKAIELAEQLEYVGTMCAHDAADELRRLSALDQQGEAVGAVLVDRESRGGVMFYSSDMLPDPTTIKDRFELVRVYDRPAADLTDEQIRAIGKKFFPKTILSAAWFGFARAIIAKVKGVE